MNDTELWHAWREKGDAEAFTTLVERYLDMVYATARRILGNPHDAEDVAQDCFIALLKGRVRVKHPLGPWLHRVARNRALDRIKGEGRRRERERAWQESAPPTEAEPAIKDILQHVDEAIDALPEELRAAVVGRFLEGRTNAALGQAGGVAESTIRLRVSKGVEEIRATLKKRGIITTAAALGALLESKMGEAAPAGLHAAIAKLSMASPPPGKTTHLARPVPPALLAGALFAVIAGLFIGERLLARSAAAPVVTITTAPSETVDETNAAPPPQPEGSQPTPGAVSVAPAAVAEEALAVATPDIEPEEPTSTVSGTIYDDRGYPLPGAIITVVSHGFAYELLQTRVFRATTGADGTYSVEDIHHRKTYWGYITSYSSKGKKFSGLVRHDPPNPSRHLQVWVTAEGFGTAGEQNVPVEAGSTKEGVDFTLSPGIAVRGRVSWPDGKPLKQAAVVLHGLLDFRGRPQYGQMEFHTTDDNGEFLLGLKDEGELILQVVSANGHPAVFTEVPATVGTMAQLTMPEPAAIAGTVRHADGTPLVHARISVQGRVPFAGDEPDFASQLESHDGSILAPVIEATYTDENGDFQFPVFAAVPDAVVTVWEPLLEDKPQSERLLTRHIGPVMEAQTTTLDIMLPGAGEIMTLAVSVVGERTGEPLPHTNVYIQRQGDKKGTHLSAGFEPPYYSANKTLTKPGAYAIWPYYNNRPMKGTRALYGKEIPWDPGATKRITFRIPEPFTLSVQVVDPSGNPIPKAEVAYVSDGSEVQSGKSDKEGRFAWNGFAPGGPGYMRASKDGYTTNESPAIIGEPGATYPEQTIVLLPTGGIEGQLVDARGQSIANATVYLRFTADLETWLQSQEHTDSVSAKVETDAGGSYVSLDAFPAAPGVLEVIWYRGPGDVMRSEPVALEPVAGRVLKLEPLALVAREPEGTPKTAR